MASPKGTRKPMFSKWYYDRSGKVEVLPTSEVIGWFNEVLDADDPKPTYAQCEVLSQKFRTIIHRQDNDEAEFERGGELPLELLRDVSPVELERKRIEKFRLIANLLLVEAEKLREFYGGYIWESTFGPPVRLEDIEEILGRIGAFPTKASPPKTSGQPLKVWHRPGREMARLIRDVLRKIGYQRSVTFIGENGAVACIGAKAISCAYGKEIKASVFAFAMRTPRDRSKGGKVKLDFYARFPEVARIKIYSAQAWP